MKPEGSVSLGKHDDEFHRSTKRILRWLVARSAMLPCRWPRRSRGLRRQDWRPLRG